MSRTVAAPIDPLGPTRAGTYEDAFVVVDAVHGPPRRRGLRSVRTEHFALTPVDGRLHVAHTLPPDAVDDDLAGLLERELFGPGWVRGPELFERIFTGIVRSTAPEALDSWELFYRNTLRRAALAREEGGGSGHGSIAGYAPVHDHVLSLLEGRSVLELGCCFGFLSLQLAASGRRTTASDVSPGTVRLLGEVAPRLGVSLGTVVADAARVPLEDDHADDVLVVHLLEHLDPEHGSRVVAESVRLARRRVVVAVPFEDEPTEAYGHVRTVTTADLVAWGRATGLPFDVHEHHGGWLVVDTAGLR